MAKKKGQPKQARQVQKKNGQAPSTQQHIPFAEIRDNVIIMKDGTLRTIILVSSLNFALKSEDEQKGIVQGYVSFLNTIDFSVQIVIQSRKLNIENYLGKLDIIMRQQTNELLRKQTASYRSFIAKLVEEADIMDKKFFVVVPFSPFGNKRKGFFSRFREVLSPASIVKLKQSKFEQYKEEMGRRVGLTLSGLRGVGLTTQILDTQALIEMFYNTYNPASTQKKRIENIHDMQVDWSVK